MNTRRGELRAHTGEHPERPTHPLHAYQPKPAPTEPLRGRTARLKLTLLCHYEALLRYETRRLKSAVLLRLVSPHTFQMMPEAHQHIWAPYSKRGAYLWVISR